MGIKLWELIKWCAEGAYVSGDVFIDGNGQELFYDGEQLKGIEKADINSIWFYWNEGYEGINE